MKKLYALGLVALGLLPIGAQAQVLGENMIENFETVHKIKYGFRSGTLDSGIVNPVSGGINTSAAVGKYVRDSATQYDVIVCNLKDGVMQGIGSYVAGTKKFVMKVYTNAPVGTNVQLTVQNAAQATAAYPVGRHSQYEAITTTTGAWENLVFNFLTQPSANVDPSTLDQLIISFNNNSFTKYRYYFDDLAGPAMGSAPVVPNNEFLWTDFYRNDRLRYRGSDGAPSRAANPARSAAHVADSCAKYVRSGVQYDVLRYTWNGPLSNLSDYRTNQKKFSLNVYSPAAGTTVQFTLQDSVRALQPYPNGRFGEFVGQTTVNGGWERVTLNWANTPDPSVTDAQVNELAILFNSNTFNPVTVYMDTIFGPPYTPVASVKSALAQQAELTPNPADGYSDLILAAPARQAMAVSVVDAQGRVVLTDRIAAGQDRVRIQTASLAPGLYTCRTEGVNRRLVVR